MLMNVRESQYTKCGKPPANLVTERGIKMEAVISQSNTRATFLMRTYAHLFGAIILFTTIEIFLFRSGLAFNIASAMARLPWIAILGAFMIVSWLASRAAHRAQSYQVQYLALLGFVVAEALIFVPLLLAAQSVAPGVIQNAALLTIIGFTGLTGIAWTDKSDFTFLGGLLKWGGIVAILAIIGGLVFSFSLGLWFSVAMVAFAGAAILFDTSNTLHHYPEDKYVSAALQLFASVALMFWYLLRIVMSFSSD